MMKPASKILGAGFYNNRISDKKFHHYLFMN